MRRAACITMVWLAVLAMNIDFAAAGWFCGRSCYYRCYSPCVSYYGCYSPCATYYNYCSPCYVAPSCCVVYSECPPTAPQPATPPSSPAQHTTNRRAVESQAPSSTDSKVEPKPELPSDEPLLGPSQPSPAQTPATQPSTGVTPEPQTPESKLPEPAAPAAKTPEPSPAADNLFGPSNAPQATPAQPPAEQAKPADEATAKSTEEAAKAKEAAPAKEKPAEEKPTEEKKGSFDELFSPDNGNSAQQPPAESKPAENSPAESKPTEEKPAEKPAAEKPAAGARDDLFGPPPSKAGDAASKSSSDNAAPAETKAAEPNATPSKAAETEPAETKPAETKPAESKPAESKPAEEKPADTKPAEPSKKKSDGQLDDLFGPTTYSTSVPGGLASDEFRTWTDDTGRYSTPGRLVRILPDKVQLLKDNGHTTTVPLARLSANDLAFVDAQRLAVARENLSVQTAQK